MSCKECFNLDTCMEVHDSVDECDILFIQNSFKVESGVNGFRPEDIKQMKRQFHEVFRSHTVNYINLVNCYLDGGKNPVKKDIEACREFVEFLIDKCNPKYILPMGSQVFQVITGKKKFTNWVGRKIDINGINVIPIYHPDYAVKSKQRQREYNTQTQNAVRQILGGDRDPLDGKKYDLVVDHREICDMLDMLIDKENIVQAFDYETTNLIPAKGYPVCLSISWDEDKAVCLYWFDKQKFIDTGEYYVPPKIYRSVRRWMKSKVPKVAQNVKFENKWTIRHFDCEPNNVIGDTKQLAHLLDENSQRKLSDLAYQFTDMGGYDAPMQEFLDEGHEHWEADPEFMMPYSCGDSDCTRQIYMKQIKELCKDSALFWLHKNIVLPATYTLARAEEHGMALDEGKMAEVECELIEEIETIEKRIQDYPEVKKTLKYHNKDKTESKKLKKINLNSSPQVKTLLYRYCKLPVLNKSKKSKEPSTDADTLDLLKDMHPVVKDIVLLRSYAYQLSDLETIVNKMIDGTVFSDLIQDFVVSGRLSSRNPNLQNIKGGTEEEPSLVKICFVSRFEGGVITQSDYNQLELRLIGSEAREPKFKKAFQEGIDLHSMTGAEVNDIPLKEFIKHKSGKYKELRTDAKRVNFGCQYNITEHGLSKQLNCSEREAKEKIDKWWATYQMIKKWDKANQKEVSKTLQIRSTLGRIRHLPDAASSNRWAREAALRQASNFKIQNLGAEITMWAMVNVDLALRNCGLRSVVIGQVHDSVLVDTHPDEKEDVREILYDVMEVQANALFTFLWIPLKIDMEEGENWNDLRSVKLKRGGE